MWLVSSVTASLLVVLAVRAQQQDSSELEEADDQRAAFLNSLGLSNFYSDNHLYAKRDLENAMPGVLRFGKRDAFIQPGDGGDAELDGAVQKKEMPGVLRFGKRSAIDNEKKSMPGVLRFGKRGDMPGVLRFGKREMPGVLRFGKRDDIPGVLRFGKRDEIPGVLRFGKREIIDEFSPSRLLLKKSVPGVLRFGRK